MFRVDDDMSIHVTRGDIAVISLSADNDGTDYVFKQGDIVRMTVYGRKAADTVLLKKDFPVFEETTKVQMFLGEEDTRLGDVISKPTDYWYEVELNPDSYPQTIIGYDDDGAKILRLYPEGYSERM